MDLLVCILAVAVRLRDGEAWLFAQSRHYSSKYYWTDDHRSSLLSSTSCMCQISRLFGGHRAMDAVGCLCLENTVLVVFTSWCTLLVRIPSPKEAQLTRQFLLDAIQVCIVLWYVRCNSVQVYDVLKWSGIVRHIIHQSSLQKSTCLTNPATVFSFTSH